MQTPEFNPHKHADQIAASASIKCGVPVLILIPIICSVINVCVNCWANIIRKNRRSVDDGIRDLCRSYAERPSQVVKQLTITVFFNANPSVKLSVAKAIAESMLEHAQHEPNHEHIKLLLMQSP